MQEENPRICEVQGECSECGNVLKERLINPSLAQYNTCHNTNHLEVKAGGLRVQGQSGPNTEFEASLGYIRRPYLKNINE
jgi:hypothetical protein